MEIGTARQPHTLPDPDREAVSAAARSIHRAGLWCVVEVRADEELEPGARWRPELIAFRGASPSQVLEAVEQTIASVPDRRVRLAGYDPSTLVRSPLPATLVCS
jgi:hypothetical protein